MLEVLFEVPPHGCGGPWPGMTGGVAEWWWVGSELRPFARAGRRSAGLGGGERAQPVARAGGVRARGEQAICSGDGHQILTGWMNEISYFIIGFSMTEYGYLSDHFKAIKFPP